MIPVCASRAACAFLFSCIGAIVIGSLSPLGIPALAQSRISDTPPHSEKADPARGLSFPVDHGSHPLFETEWWYVTGHLVPKGEPVFGAPTSFGVQLTFFRRRKGDGSWGQLYAAHGALGDVQARTFTHDMRYARSGMGLVSLSERSLQISLLDWGMESISDRWLLRWSVGTQAHVRLITSPVLPSMIIRHGQDGFSKKAPCEQCASMYYSVPQLRAEGEIRFNDRTIPVEGVLWMDHEFMSNALQPEQVGWDWFSLMTNTDQSIMLFRVRGKEGFPDYASGSLITAEGVTPLRSEDFSIQAESSWVSPHSGATYPHRWRIRVPKGNVDEVMESLLPDQEIRAGEKDPITYWEGAIANRSNTVKGFAELTGYDKPISPGL